VFATPTVAGDRVFIGACSGFFYALDKDSGQLRWSYNIKKDGIPFEFHGDPYVADSLVAVASDGRGTGHIYAFEAATGKVRWKFPVQRGVPTDVIGNGKNVYAVSYNDSLFCLDLQSGRLRWKVAGESLGRNRFSTHAPAIANERVFYANSAKKISALNAETGNVIWTREFGDRISSEIGVRGDRLYLGTVEQKIYCLDQKTGNILNEISVESIPVATPAIGEENIFFFLNPHGYRGGAKVIIRLDLDLQKVIWRKEAETEWSSARPVLWQEMLLAGNDRGEIFAFRDGELQWSKILGGVIRGIGGTKDVIYVGTLSGMVHALQSNSGLSNDMVR
jgi:outer membrane protein assembly factor BamB